MKNTRNFTVLADVIVGGEWNALYRLFAATKNENAFYSFSLIAFGNKLKTGLSLFDKTVFIKHESPAGIFGFFRKQYSEFKNLRHQIIKLEKIKKTDYFLVADYLSFLAALSVRIDKSKIIFLFHGIRSLPIRSVFDINYRQLIIKFLERLTVFISDAVIVPSISTKGYLLSLLFPFSFLKKIYVIPNIVPNDFFSPKTGSSKFQNILYSGRLRFYKGIIDLIKAFGIFLEYFPKANLTIAYPVKSSEHELETQAQKLINDLGISKNTIFVKNPTNAHLINIYKKTDITVLPSELENSPLSVLESLAIGVPVIGTNTGDMPDLLNRLDKNLILNNNSSKEIFLKLVWYFNLSKSKRTSLKIRSTSLVKNNKPKLSAQKFINVIRVLESKKYPK